MARSSPRPSDCFIPSGTTDGKASGDPFPVLHPSSTLCSAMMNAPPFFFNTGAHRDSATKPNDLGHETQNLSTKTIDGYVSRVRFFAGHFGRSPERRGRKEVALVSAVPDSREEDLLERLQPDPLRAAFSVEGSRISFARTLPDVELVPVRRSWDSLVFLSCYPCSMSRWRMNSLTASGCVNGSKWPAPVTTTSGRVCLTGSVRSADPWIWNTRTPLVLALGCQVRAAQLAQRRNVDCGFDRRFHRPATTAGRHGVSDRATPAASRPKPVGPSIATGRIARMRKGVRGLIAHLR